MNSQSEIRSLQNAHIVDRDGDKVGKVSQLYLTDDSREPSWVTVNTGFFGTKESFIPLAEARLDGDTLQVPYDKATIKGAPHVPDDGNISREDEEELYRYYNVEDPHTSTGDADARREVQEDPYADADRGRHADRSDAAAGAGGAAAAGAGNAAHRDTDSRREVQADPYADADRGRHADRSGAAAGAGDAAASAAAQPRLRRVVVEETEIVERPVQREKVVLEDGQGNVIDDDVDVSGLREDPNAGAFDR